jgi:hypothetical protein
MCANALVLRDGPLRELLRMSATSQEMTAGCRISTSHSLPVGCLILRAGAARIVKDEATAAPSMPPLPSHTASPLSPRSPLQDYERRGRNRCAAGQSGRSSWLPRLAEQTRRAPSTALCRPPRGRTAMLNRRAASVEIRREQTQRHPPAPRVIVGIGWRNGYAARPSRRSRRSLLSAEKMCRGTDMPRRPPARPLLRGRLGSTHAPSGVSTASPDNSWRNRYAAERARRVPTHRRQAGRPQPAGNRCAARIPPAATSIRFGRNKYAAEQARRIHRPPAGIIVGDRTEEQIRREAIETVWPVPLSAEQMRRGTDTPHRPPPPAPLSLPRAYIEERICRALTRRAALSTMHPGREREET